MTRSHEEPHLEMGPLGLSAEVAKSIAERLVLARLQKGLTVQELSRRVRIREHFTQAIESGNWSTLPPGLNGRGLVRLYARELGVRVPELDPSAHLTEGNARVELAEQALAYDALREHTIRTMKPGAVAAPVDRGAPRGPAGVRRAKRAPFWGGTSVEVPTSDRAVPSSAKGSASFGAGLSDVVTPNIEDVLGLNLQTHEPAREVLPNFSEQTVRVRGEGVLDSRENLGAPLDGALLGKNTPVNEGPLSSAEDPEEVPSVDVYGVLGMNRSSGSGPSDQPVSIGEAQGVEHFAEASRTEVSGSQGLEVDSMHLAGPKTVSLGHADGAADAFVSQSAHTLPNGVIGAENQAAHAVLGYEGRRRRRGKAGLYVGLVSAAVVLLVVIIGVLQQRQSSKNQSLGIRDLSEPAPSKQERRSASGQPREVTPVVPVERVPEAETAMPSELATSNGQTQAPDSSAHADGELQEAGVASAPEPAAAVADAAPSAAATASPQKAEGIEQLGSGLARAKLRISSPVEIQLRADGQELANGLRSTGELELLFDKKAEILVDDGSRVSLEYAGWNHGVLGYEGRRRRLILQAAPYSP